MEKYIGVKLGKKIVKNRKCIYICCKHISQQICTDSNIPDKIQILLCKNLIIFISMKVRTILFLFLMSFSPDPGSSLLPTSFASSALTNYIRNQLNQFLLLLAHKTATLSRWPGVHLYESPMIDIKESDHLSTWSR